MAPKKAGKKKGGKSRKSRIPTNLTEMPFEYQMPSAAQLTERAPQFIRIRICLVTWQHMNTDIRVKTTATIQSIKDIIRERHGGTVTNIQLYKDQVHPLNLLSDNTKTLEEAGILGIMHSQPKDDARQTPTDPSALLEPEAILYYDFTPHRSSCPLLMSDLNMAHPKASTIPMLPSLSGLHTNSMTTAPFSQGSTANLPPGTPTTGSYLGDGRGRESPGMTGSISNRVGSANTPLNRLRPLSGSSHVSNQLQPHPPSYPSQGRLSAPSSSRGVSGHNSARVSMSPLPLPIPPRGTESIS